MTITEIDEKFMREALAEARAAAAVAACGFDARVRGETLDPAQFAALSNALRAKLG